MRSCHDLVPRLFLQVFAPPAVVEEFGETPDWLDVQEVVNRTLSEALRTQLDAGESEVWREGIRSELIHYTAYILYIKFDVSSCPSCLRRCVTGSRSEAPDGTGPSALLALSVSSYQLEDVVSESRHLRRPEPGDTL